MRKPRTGLIPLVFLTGLCHAAPVLAQQPAPGLWDRLQGLVAQEGEQIQHMLAGQQQLDTKDKALQEQLEQSRRMRAMHREAALLSALNITYIYDELDHWDCRIAEQKVHEVDRRLAELSDFAQRIDSLCGGLGTDTQYQQKACTQQRSELSQSVTELETLRQRYATACPIKNQQLKPIGGKQPW